MNNLELNAGYEFELPSNLECTINTSGSGSYKKMFKETDNRKCKIEKVNAQSIYISMLNNKSFSPKFKGIRILKKDLYSSSNKNIYPIKLYNKDELKYIAVHFAIACLNNSTVNFDDWFNETNWRKIANKNI